MEENIHESIRLCYRRNIGKRLDRVHWNENIPDSNPSGVESRGLPKVQQPAQPGAKMAPSSTARRKFRLPTLASKV